MVFIIFGWNKQTRRICCTLNEVNCNNCGEISEWIVMRTKTWFTLFFIPVLPYEIKQFAYCSKCNCGAEINDKQWKFLRNNRDENKHVNLQPFVVEYTYTFLGWFMRGLTKRKWRCLAIYLFIFNLFRYGCNTPLLIIHDIGMAVVSTLIIAVVICLIYALISKLAKRHIIGIKLC